MMVADLIANNGPQPRAKRVSRLLLAKGVQTARQGAKHLLHHVGRVIGLQTAMPAPLIHEWPIHLREPLPGHRIISRRAPNETAGGGVVRFGLLAGVGHSGSSGDSAYQQPRS